MMTIGPKQSDEERPGYYGAVVMQQTIFSILTTGILWLGMTYSHQINPQWQVAHLASPLAASLFFFQNQDFLRRLFFTGNHPVLALISDAISYLGRVIAFILTFSYATLSTADVLWIIAISSALGSVVGFSQIKAMVFNSEQLIPVFKRHWVLSKWMTASAAMEWMTGNIFIVMSGSLMGASAVGAIRAALNIIGIINIIMQGLGNIVPVRAAIIYEKQGAGFLVKYINKIMINSCLAVGLILAVICFNAEGLMQWVYGVEYSVYSYVIYYLATATFISIICMPIGAGLRVIEKTKALFLGVSLSAVFSAISAYLLVTLYGLNGALVGIIISKIISTSIPLLTFYKVTSLLSINFKRS